MTLSQNERARSAPPAGDTLHDHFLPWPEGGLLDRPANTPQGLFLILFWLLLLTELCYG